MQTMRAESACKSSSERSSMMATRFEHTINLIANRGASLVAIVAARQELIVPRMTVANVREYGEVSAPSSTDWPAAVRPTRPLPRRAQCPAIVRASLGAQPENNLGISCAICAARSRSYLVRRSASRSRRAQLTIGQAFLLRLS